MNHFFSPYKDYHPTSFIRTVQRVLLFLILVGIVLLLTQKVWVPKLVSYIIQNESENRVPTVSTHPIATTSSPTSTPVLPPAKNDSGVKGVVTIGPTCPVVREGADCGDKPYKTVLVIASTIIGRQGGVLVYTDAEGQFSHELAPGTYTIRAQGESILPRLEPVTFVVKEHAYTTVNLQFDSGIR